MNVMGADSVIYLQMEPSGDIFAKMLEKIGSLGCLIRNMGYCGLQYSIIKLVNSKNPI
jgi:hypothetical protein